MTVPRCVFEAHQSMVDVSILSTIVLVANFEARERTRAGIACLAAMLLSVIALINLSMCKCTAYGAVELLTIAVQVSYMANKVASIKSFDAIEYATHVVAINFVSWLGMQYMLNFCITRGVDLQFGAAAADGMPDRTPHTRHIFNPGFFSSAE